MSIFVVLCKLSIKNTSPRYESGQGYAMVHLNRSGASTQTGGG